MKSHGVANRSIHSVKSGIVLHNDLFRKISASSATCELARRGVRSCLYRMVDANTAGDSRGYNGYEIHVGSSRSHYYQRISSTENGPLSLLFGIHRPHVLRDATAFSALTWCVALLPVVLGFRVLPGTDVIDFKGGR